MAVRLWRAPARIFVLAFLVLAVLATQVNAGSAYLEGVDVSHWNGTPDWSAVRADGIQFAIAKATEGQTFVDGEYATNRAQAAANGVAFTAYHFAQPDNTRKDAIREADHFVDTAQLGDNNLLPVLDLEVNNSLGPKKLRAWTRAWLERVEARLGVKPMIYTSPSFWVNRMGNTRWFADNGYRLWIAHWGAAQPSVPANNWGGRGWTLWQYTNQGTVDGISGNVDLDRYAGTSLAPLRIKNN